MTLSCSMAAGRRRSAATSNGLPPVLAEHLGQLAAGGGLTRALQAAHHEDGRPGLLEPDRRVDGAHQLAEFVVDDRDDLLARVERLDRRCWPTACSVTFSMNSLATSEIDVGFEECGAYFAEAVLDIGLGQQPTRAELPEGRGKPFLQVVEHGRDRSRSLGLSRTS